MPWTYLYVPPGLCIPLALDRAGQQLLWTRPVSQQLEHPASELELRPMVCARSVSFSTALRPRFIASSQRHKPRHYRDSWAKTSAKKETRGVRRCDPLSARRAHYLSADQMDQIIAGTRSNYASFGGVMLWDAYAARCECAHVNLDLNLSFSQAESSTFSSVRLHSSPGIASQTLAVTYSHALVF